MTPIDHNAIDAALNDLIQPPRIPRATYRLQFNANFTFRDALALVPYLDALGISDVYASPLFKPRPGSMHGYDTVDYTQFNPALGTEDDFNALAEALAERGMGLFLDIVPNHMGVSTENAWWFDVIKQGPSSSYARYFDIDWRPQNRALDDKVLLPVLGDHYGRILEAGELKVVYWHGDFYLHYYEHQFPMTPESYRHILELVLEHLPEELDEADAWVPLELASVVRSLAYLPAYTNTDPDMIDTRSREGTIIRWRVLGLFDKSEIFRVTLREALDIVNGTPDDPDSFDLLDDLLGEQAYRLAYWRVATDEINYRRFFDINDLAALRIEDAQVFADVHALAFRLLAEGKISGLRIDHPDGLWDPAGYFWNLQMGYLEAALRQRLDDEGDYGGMIAARLETLRNPTNQLVQWPVYVLVEKILSESEPLPDSWAVHGTTGYDFMYMANNLFVKREAEAAFDTLYAEFVEDVTPLADLTDYTKKLVLTQSLASELEARSAELARLVEQTRRYRGFTQNSLVFAMREFIAALDIYRTYISRPGAVSERDREYIEEAIEQAKKRNPLVLGTTFDFLRDTLLMENFDKFAEEHRGAVREFVMKFQQITGPVMAKSMEDTAFYIYNRLVSLNEVGGHLNRFGATVAEFHAHNAEIRFPNTMLSSSTHDTKRSEDVRARINVLSEMADEWAQVVREWKQINDHARSEAGDIFAPSRNDEYLIYQTLVGTYQPGIDDDDTFVGRIIGYMHKAINEAKTHSNWINPNAAYGQAIADFVSAIWDNVAFRESFDDLTRRVIHFGRFNSLSQTLLKLTCPGMPDIYQGNELWDYSLVDPDNRRPVDFERRDALLQTIHAGADDRPALVRDLLASAESGGIKLYLTAQTLAYRRENAALLSAGDYQAVTIAGEHAAHVCAYLRTHEESAALVVVPRLIATMTGGRLEAPTGAIWGDTRLVIPDAIAGRELEDIFTGRRFDAAQHIALADLLESAPFALLDCV
ncbi:MAG: malto-oligosyltrehalose synthase [Anaerolineaceae bacterium]|nr:MAG: malto-oligosyltrehalose synthase [Anaerolineaceae bacterium]